MIKDSYQKYLFAYVIFLNKKTESTKNLPIFDCLEKRTEEVSNISSIPVVVLI